MEMNTIIGIVIAVVIMLIGLVIILKKQKPIDTDLDETEAYVDADSQQPVLPRHERQQLLDDALAQTKRVEPSLKAEPIQANTPHLAPVAANDELKSKPVVESESSKKVMLHQSCKLQKHRNRQNSISQKSIRHLLKRKLNLN